MRKAGPVDNDGGADTKPYLPHIVDTLYRVHIRPALKLEQLLNSTPNYNSLALGVPTISKHTEKKIQIHYFYPVYKTKCHCFRLG